MVQYLFDKYSPVNQVNSELIEQNIWLDQLQRNTRSCVVCENSLLNYSCIIAPPPCSTNSYKPSRVTVKGFCAQCHGIGKLICGQCNGISYCSKKCQRSNWKVHKLVCNKEAVFEEGSVIVCIPKSDKSDNNNRISVVMSCIGAGSSTHTQGKTKNCHGDSRFVIKCQIGQDPSNSANEEIMIYDQGKVLFIILNPSEQPAHSAVHKLVRSKGFRKLKAYLYAKIEGCNMRVYTNEMPNQQEHLQAW